MFLVETGEGRTPRPVSHAIQALDVDLILELAVQLGRLAQDLRAQLGPNRHRRDQVQAIVEAAQRGGK